MKKDLSQLFSEYIRERELVSRLRSETIRGYRHTFDLFRKIMPEMSNQQAVTSQTMIDFFSRLEHRTRVVGVNTKKTGVKASTIRTYWSKLNSFFEWLRIRKYTEENPLGKIKPPQPIYDDHRALKNEQISRILSAVTLHSIDSLLKKRDLLMIQLLTFCGLRRNELISLELRDIDLDKRVLTVRGETSKSKKTRQIPMHPVLVTHMEDYFAERRKCGYKTQSLLIAKHSERGLTVFGLKKWVEKIKGLSGVRFHLHRFRHTFACNLAKQNTNTIKLQRLLGHTDLRMTERYVRSLTIEDLREDINRMNIDN